MLASPDPQPAASRPVPTFPEVTYRILRGDPAAQAIVVLPDGAATPLPPRFDLVRHSPDGFNYGYGGSGPSQLALALLAHATGDDDLALRCYHAFKQELVGRVPGVIERWEITGRAIREWVRTSGPRIGMVRGGVIPDPTPAAVREALARGGRG